MGLYMQQGKYFSNKRTTALCVIHCITVVGGSFMAIAGTYTTIQSIVDAYAAGGVKAAFTCG